MPESMSYTALAPRERSVLDAFAQGALWSQDYYDTWLRDHPQAGRQTMRFALDGTPPPPVLSAEFIRGALLGKFKTDDGMALRIDERGAHLRDATIEGPLDLTAIEFRKPIHFENCIFKHPITLADAKLGHVCFDNSSVPEIRANLVDIESDFSLDGLRGCRAIHLRAARIRGTLRLGRAQITGKPGRQDRAINCRGAQIGGSVWMRHGFRATGTVNFVGAAIGGRIDCRGGRFSNPTDRALDCHAAKIGGSVFLSNGFCADGEVNFVNASIAGDVECQDGSFKGYGDHDAIDFEEANVGGTLYLTKVKSFEGMFDLQNAVVTSLADDGSVWNTRTGRAVLHLDLFHYASFANDYGERNNTALDSRTRLAWLKRQPKKWWSTDFRPQPFTQCAKALRGMGHTTAARRILYAREKGRLKRSDIGRIEWIVGAVLYLFAGHGYKTRRAIYWLIAIWLVGVAIFALAYRDGQMRIASEPVMASQAYLDTRHEPKDYEPFKPILYSLDVIIPIVDLGEHRYWTPRDGSGDKPGPRRNEIWWLNALPSWIVSRLPDDLHWLPKIYYWFEIVMGWFLTTIAIAGFTGVLGPERGD